MLIFYLNSSYIVYNAFLTKKIEFPKTFESWIGIFLKKVEDLNEDKRGYQ